jgi:hypothetical protein
VERPPSSDPIQDLRTGWDTHVDFALRNPSLYRLMNSPAMRTPPLAAAESHRILTGDLERAAAQGKLRMAPEPAAQIIMSANVGVALMLVARPATFDDPSTSRRVRDAVHASVFTADAFASGSASEGTREGAREGGRSAQIAPTAARLNALLRHPGDSVLSVAEQVLLAEWLNRLSNAPDRSGAAPGRNDGAH